MPRFARPRRILSGSLCVITLPVGAAACGSPASGDAAGTTTGSGTANTFPVTVENCGTTMTFTKPPERVVLLKSSAVPYLADIGVLDKVVSKAGQYPKDYYDPATLSALDAIPTLTDKLDPSGHLQISKEVVLAQEPDLVLGLTDTVNAQTLASSGIPLLEIPALCKGGPPDTPGFESVYSQLDMYGRIFGRQQQARQAIASLNASVEQVTSRVPQRSGSTGAVLYPTVGGGTTYAYGNLSMADPQLELAGFSNVFGDVDQRVFEISAEQLLAKDPDVIVLLYSEGSPADVRAALTSLPGADRLTAVKNGHVLVQLFNFTEPPSPLALTGLENIEKTFVDVT